MKFHTDKTGESPLCRMCRVENETVSHIVNECKMLVQKEYKRRHDIVCRYIHWKLCEKHDFQRAQQWYEHEPDGVIENKQYKILWVLQSSVIPRLKLDGQILFLLIKP